MELPVLGLAAQIVIIVFALSAVGIVVVSYCCFNDNDADMFWHDNYAECQRPYVAAKETCNHTGDKTDVVVWTTTTCECVHTICDNCGKVLKENTDCR